MCGPPLLAAPIGLERRTMANGSCDRPNLRTLQEQEPCGKGLEMVAGMDTGLHGSGKRQGGIRIHEYMTLLQNQARKS
ncbi:hypothetical protein UY3_07851 [Chelonia mydas]|uniref:Uncharacterized protein n=1 Tax=Chelonia mydas TaxID=8469 RepID=M7BSB5_CHEMY|nr:hypothetical protein UY3_07851 [Chelonia mydas]